ncbi:hypothetical protein DHD05_01795 [Arenibacter sp. N53]|uniref:AAA family ATPase n=1 Tax=Arenibacter TaxID=178469 RepID=UPI000CD49213|nr:MULTISPECIES: AAA family ATPase [Arenibacter]MCM4150309.1 hypothetical protein [Arenibacter sp. N53]
MTFHETILKKLLEYREANPDFKFLTRQRSGAGKRFESGHWFQGNDDYAFVGLINASGGSNRTRSVGISINPTAKSYSCYLEIVFNEEKDKELISCYEALAKKIPGIKSVGDTKYNARIGDLTDNDFSQLYTFLDKNYELLLNEFKKRGKQSVLVSDKKFEQMLLKINEYRYANTPNKNQTTMENKALNIILYGPPGTGKTYRLKNEYFERFTISESSLTKEQYIINLVSELTWWQTFAIALYDSGKTSVNNLLQHEIVMAKESMSKAKNIRPIAWSRMQAHTVMDCPNVNVTDRNEPMLFVKESDSEWRIIPELVEELYPEGIELLKKVKSFQTNKDEPIKNYELVTFHQSFSYEDFVEGIKPRLDEGNTKLEYEITDGVFKKLCQRAENDIENYYAIFIDEINRGNVSAIFGELITLIEEDKRIGNPQELRTKLPYSKIEFGVPPNISIIGTMNTADRSVEALDTALRRRFVFEEVMPKPHLLEKITYEGFNLREVLETINGRIEALLDRDHKIGHSYFIKLESGDKKGLSHVFKNNIIPLLQEYFYNDYEKIALVLGEGFVTEKAAEKIKFAKFKNIEIPETNTVYELLTQIENIEVAVGLLLNRPND